MKREVDVRIVSCQSRVWKVMGVSALSVVRYLLCVRMRICWLVLSRNSAAAQTWLRIQRLSENRGTMSSPAAVADVGIGVRKGFIRLTDFLLPFCSRSMFAS